MDGKRSKSPHWNRREVLQTGLKGGAAAMAAAYGLRPDFALAQVPSEFDGTKFQLRAPEPNPKRGGVLRYGITCRPPHFDVHQSGTVGNVGTQGPMYDCLIRAIRATARPSSPTSRGSTRSRRTARSTPSISGRA